MVIFFIILCSWGHICSFGGLIFKATALVCSMSPSSELKVSHRCCMPCPGCSCNCSFGMVEVQHCAQGRDRGLAGCVSLVQLWPKAVLPPTPLLPDFTKNSLSPHKEGFGLAAHSFPSPVGRNGAIAATWLHFTAWGVRSDFSRVPLRSSSYWWTINWPNLGFWT